MTAREDSVARELLASARALADRSSTDTRGLWPRAAVLLARQALEVALKTYWSATARGVEECSTRAQLLCLGAYLGDEGLARRANSAWGTLSRASHHHAYDLSPTREEVLASCDTVLAVIEETERAWRGGRRS
jgi:hypothetical protein